LIEQNPLFVSELVRCPRCEHGRVSGRNFLNAGCYGMMFQRPPTGNEVGDHATLAAVALASNFLREYNGLWGIPTYWNSKL
jgi:hypothetical protein